MAQRVLCIENDEATRERLRRLLEGSGFAVEETTTGSDGMERARSAAPDLVLASTGLPDVEGLELPARLKRGVAHARVFVVALGPSAKDRDAALAAGFDGFIARPSDDARIVEEVKALLADANEQGPGGKEPRRGLAEPEGSAFMCALAHELSTPLTPLAGYVKILQSERLGVLSAQQRKVVDGMAIAVTKITHILDNLSDFARLQAGQSAIIPSQVDPDILAQDVVNELGGAARDARLHLEVRPSHGGAVVADVRKLRQALANVVQNAVKFSPHGGQVLVDVTRATGRLRFCVYDQGPGVVASSVERIFEPFHYAERTGDAHPTGSGLGLPVARRIAEAHGGQLVVESPPHTQPSGHYHFSGSKFIIDIPAEPIGPSGAIGLPKVGG
ncbi:MAG TPA: hybrid sensor histidine kinase/response regulator [Anaeromyxobacteraceae bacterium]|nr:hybrid sensor histidine kinase/response regulator [Anaeromyxobacteraceae bacterium]